LLLRSAALLALLGAVRAQCTLDALPDNTQFVDPDSCSVGADGIPDGTICTIQCEAGYAQGAGGTYDYVCDGTDLTDAEPDCNVCLVDEFNDTPGAAECTDCPGNSGTAGTGSTDVSACECVAGFAGDTAVECEACAFDTYKAGLGPGPCTMCPANSGTDGETGQTDASACLCDPGFAGTIGGPLDVCRICPANTYKAGSGPGPCDACPLYSVTQEEGATTVRQCECDLGHTGTIADPTDTCVRCGVGSYKDVVGDEKCTACPEHSTTEDLGALPCLPCRQFCRELLYSRADTCAYMYVAQGLAGHRIASVLGAARA
jgi:hypothetical protein